MNDSRCTLICCTFDRERANRAPGRRNLTPLYSPTGGVGTSASGGGDPVPAEATLWVNRSVDCPEAPAQANSLLYSPAAATRDAAVGGTYSPAVTTRDVTAGGSTSSAARRSVVASAEGVGPAANAAVLDASPSTSSVCHGDTVPEPVGRLGDVVTLDARLPGGVS